jgi:hypothetical protein
MKLRKEFRVPLSKDNETTDVFPTKTLREKERRK